MMTDHDDNDGFINPKTHRKKNKNKSDTVTADKDTASTTALKKKKSQQKSRNHYDTTTSSSCSTVRFGGHQWAKPSTPVHRITPSEEETPAMPSTLTSTAEPLKTKRTSDDSLPESTTTPISTKTDNESPNAHTETSINNNTTKSSTSSSSSMWPGQMSQHSLASLLEDYGTYDPNWRKVEPTGGNIVEDNDDVGTNLDSHSVLLNHDCFGSSTSDMVSERPSHNPNEPSTEPVHPQPQLQQEENGEEQHEEIVNGINRLQLHGHAPIHVELVSFGYRYGIPAEIRYYSTGNCYTQPLVPFDTRTALAPLPHYMLHLDGKSGLLKNTLLRWNPTDTSNTCGRTANYINVRNYINEQILPPITEAIIAAIDIGQHGYVSPITISIYLGSDHGKHRSVATAELTAVALRNQLRTNPHNQFHCPISVGCRHRDIMNTTLSHSSSKSNGRNVTSKKQKAFEDDED